MMGTKGERLVGFDIYDGFGVFFGVGLIFGEGGFDAHARCDSFGNHLNNNWKIKTISHCTNAISVVNVGIKLLLKLFENEEENTTIHFLHQLKGTEQSQKQQLFQIRHLPQKTSPIHFLQAFYVQLSQNNHIHPE